MFGTLQLSQTVLRKSELILNVSAGASALSWSVLGLLNADETARYTTARVCVSAINLTVGVLFLARRPIVHDGDLRSFVLCVPSFVVGASALQLAPSPEAWPMPANVVFAAGTVLAVISFLYLGRCFAVLPVVRGCVVRGPYRAIRHPAYLGELCMIAACCLAGPNPYSIGIAATALPLVAIRIHIEEKILLRGSPDYVEYAAAVRWRLVPGLW